MCTVQHFATNIICRISPLGGAIWTLGRKNRKPLSDSGNTRTCREDRCELQRRFWTSSLIHPHCSTSAFIDWLGIFRQTKLTALFASSSCSSFVTLVVDRLLSVTSRRLQWNPLFTTANQSIQWELVKKIFTVKKIVFLEECYIAQTKR